MRLKLRIIVLVYSVSLFGVDCDGSDGDKLGGLFVNKVYVMYI